MQTQHSTAFLRRRKFLMVLPLLILPFLTMAFWSLGGGSGLAKEESPVSKGLNLLLPDAAVDKEKPRDKMDLYDQAQQDSTDQASSNRFTGDSLSFAGSGLKPGVTELAIQSKLAQINAEVNSNPVKTTYGPGSSTAGPQVMNTDVAKLEALMAGMQKSGGGEDSEMRQLSAMMDKIMAIQNPDLVRAQANVAAVKQVDSLFRAIPAEVASTLKAVEGTVIELKLLDTILLNGQVLPKGHSIFGLASFSNQRINLEIRNIRLGNQIIPVNLTVFDRRDGMAGINAPEALFTDAINGGADDAIRSIGLLGMDQSLGTQVAGAGLDAAKGLFSKKVKRIKQKLRAGYSVLLRDNSKKLRP